MFFSRKFTSFSAVSEIFVRNKGKSVQKLNARNKTSEIFCNTVLFSSWLLVLWIILEWQSTSRRSTLPLLTWSPQQPFSEMSRNAPPKRHYLGAGSVAWYPIRKRWCKTTIYFPLEGNLWLSRNVTVKKIFHYAWMSQNLSSTTVSQHLSHAITTFQ